MGRSPCCSKIGLHRGPWTAREDALLTQYIQQNGEGQWRSLPKKAGLLRCGKSCRLRWMNYLRPDIKRGNITPDEDDLIIRMHALLGNRWSLIAGRLPGRTDNEIKNYWNTHLSKILRSQGIDPNTHKRLPQPLLQASRKKRSKKKILMGNSKNKQKNIMDKFNHNNYQVQRTKVHNPKPSRFPSSCSFYLTNNSYSTAELSTKTREPFGQGLTAATAAAAAADRANDHNSEITYWSHPYLESHHSMPSLNYTTLDTLYEEYLQLLKTEENNGRNNVDSYFADSLIYA